MTERHDSPAQPEQVEERWEIYEAKPGTRMVTMHCCGFCFDADHEDTQGGYSCPLCEPQAELERLREALREIHKWANDPHDRLHSLVRSRIKRRARAALGGEGAAEKDAFRPVAGWVVDALDSEEEPK